MPNPIVLTPNEARVLGCLLEKEITTPEQYPLSLNALVNACNQKSNRDPVIELSERDVEHTLDDLARNRLVVSESGFGSRVNKYRHRFCNTEFGSLKFTVQELAIMCELLLRDGQMPGELRSRASRLAPFKDVEELERTLDALAAREDGPFVAKLEREPGRRESRYVHLFGDAVKVPARAASAPAPVVTPRAPVPKPDDERVARLEEAVAALREEIAALREEFRSLPEK